MALIVTLPAASYLFAEGRQLAQRSVSGGSDRPGIQIAALIDGKEAEASVPDDTSAVWPSEGIPAITIPSADVTLSFIQPGRIAKVHVREGDVVKAGQILVQQDDSAEQAQLALIRKQSEDMTQIESREADLAQKKLYLERIQWAASRGSSTEMEVEDAKLAVTMAEYALQTAHFEHEQNQRKYAEAKIRVDNMRLKSPIDGRVEELEVEVGESINGLANTIRIVRTDPLWIDVHVPLETGQTLRSDENAHIIFPGNDQNPETGKIISVSTVADAASSTLRARIQLQNASKRPAGEQVNVLFTEPQRSVNQERER
ncbi:MAG: efflux RND transporter periplasmic adaptor subunit [Nitrospiraceae bacterium]|nr:MAG: efflux RND transporter periplasmic adaptor subunit [Nitrospiraceae bacterium]